jgi:hypothetical protein
MIAPHYFKCQDATPKIMGGGKSELHRAGRPENIGGFPVESPGIRKVPQKIYRPAHN